MSTSNPANLVIIVELKDPDDFETILKDIDEELCKVGELDSAMEAFKGSNTRDNLSAAFATQLTKSHASQDAPRASSPIENIRILSNLDPPIREKLFCFKEIWLSNIGCKEVVHSEWNSFGDFGYEGEILAKVDKCGKDLNWWNKNVFGNV